MKKKGSKRALSLAKRDQVMEYFKENHQQLKDIHEDGPTCDEDVQLVKRCVAFAVAEVFLARAEKKTFNDSLKKQPEK